MKWKACEIGVVWGIGTSAVAFPEVSFARTRAFRLVHIACVNCSGAVTVEACQFRIPSGGWCVKMSCGLVW